MGKIILPKTYLNTQNYPVIFLLGPIKSAPQWHDDAIKIIFSENPDIIIASPQRTIKKELEIYVMHGNENYFHRQRAWEWHYQKIAEQKGALLFWFPKEEQHHCEKSYGLMTSNEFGHWTALYQQNKNIPLVIGGDGEFNEWNTFLYDTRIKMPDLKVQSSLEDTCKEAIRKAYLDHH